MTPKAYRERWFAGSVGPSVAILLFYRLASLALTAASLVASLSREYFAPGCLSSAPLGMDIAFTHLSFGGIRLVPLKTGQHVCPSLLMCIYNFTNCTVYISSWRSDDGTLQGLLAKVGAYRISNARSRSRRPTEVASGFYAGLYTFGSQPPYNSALGS